MQQYLTRAARDRAFLKSIWELTGIAEETNNQHLAELCVQLTKSYYEGDTSGTKIETGNRTR